MNNLQYPTFSEDDCVDNYHGVEVSDPYRWLEDPDSEKTKAFVDEQNKISKSYLTDCHCREDIHNRVKQIWDYPKYSCPTKQGDKYYFYMNTGLQNQSVLYVQDSSNGEPRVFLDPNLLSEDGTVSIATSKFSEDDKIFAYGISTSGSDWNDIHFMNTDTGEKYPDVLENVKFSSLNWTHDNKGIFYSRYMQRQTSDEGDKNHKLCYHRMGTKQSEDSIVVEFPEEPLWRMHAKVSDCGKFLILMPIKDCINNAIYYADLTPEMNINGKIQLNPIIEKFEADYDYVTNDGTKFIFRTNRNAKNYKLIVIDFSDHTEDKWVDLVPEDPHDVLEWAEVVNEVQLVTCYMRDVKNILQLRCLKTGALLRTFPLDFGTIAGFSGKKKYSEIFYKFTSFLTPGIVYKMDLNNDKEAQIFQETKVENFDPSLYKISQIFYNSKDGTKIPMFIVMKQDTVLNGNNPTLLYGYGGFNIPIQPTFSLNGLFFARHLNGVFAIANIRGGGEYGQEWHNGGKFFNKQNTFDDFQCAAEYLIENKYTNSSKLIIHGISNGGLTVAACMIQRPDLFGAVICQVGVLDMLRYHKFTIGYCWTSDYGDSDDEKYFHNLLKFSPLHNIRPAKNGSQYPATLLLTADHDDRVVPLHSLKFIATLQKKIGSLPNQTNPLLVHIDVKAGHGSGKSTTKLIEEFTNIFCFMVKSLNLSFKS